MRKAYTICLVVAIAIMLPSPFTKHYISEAEAPKITLEDYSVPQLIEYYSGIYHQDPALLKKVAECESKYGKNLKGDSGLAFSVYQFHKNTFDNWSKEFGEKLDYGSYHDHIKLAVWSFAQGENHRNAWTTYVAIKRGGTYSFYSKQLKKSFVVKCSL